MGSLPSFLSLCAPHTAPHCPYLPPLGTVLGMSGGVQAWGPWLKDPSGFEKEREGPESHHQAPSLCTPPSLKPLGGSHMRGGTRDCSTEHSGPPVHAPGQKERLSGCTQRREEPQGWWEPPSRALIAFGRTMGARVGWGHIPLTAERFRRQSPHLL